MEYLRSLPPAPDDAGTAMQFPPNAGKPVPAPDPLLKQVRKREERDPHDAAIAGGRRSAAHPGQHRTFAQVQAITPFLRG